MGFGHKIRKVRKFRGITQKQLGMLCGFEEKSAGLRIGQYERNTKTPREDTLKQIVSSLNVSKFYMKPSDSFLFSEIDIIQFLFEIDDYFQINTFEYKRHINTNEWKDICESPSIAFSFERNCSEPPWVRDKLCAKQRT